MKRIKKGIIEDLLYREIDRTIYEIIVKQSENAKETAEDIILRMIAEEMDLEREEDKYA